MIDDEIYQKALTLVFESGRSSISWIRRNFYLSWSDAEAIINRIEAEGHISSTGLNGSRIAIDWEPARSIRMMKMEEEFIASNSKSAREVAVADKRS